MNRKEVCSEILRLVGGETNVRSVSHCATRLRVAVADESLVDVDALKKVPDVMGVAKTPTEYQMIIGPGVDSYYMEFVKLGNFTQGGNVEPEKTTKGNFLYSCFAFLGEVILPALPVIIAGGMISAVLVVCTTFFGMSNQSNTYVILNSIYDAAFYFLPIYIGYNAAQKLNVTPMLGALLGAVLVSNSINGVGGLDFLGIPVAQASYNSTLLPVVFGVVFMQFVWKPLDRIVPKEIKFFVVPMLTMIVTVPVTLICIGPIANYVAGIIASILLWMNENLGFVSIGAMGALTSILIFSGTAGGLYAPVGIAFATLGFEGFVMPGMLAGNVAVGGAALAAMTLCKNDDNKAAALSAGLTAVFGITEPAIFGVLVKYRKPFIGAIAGGLVGGCFAGLVSLKEFAFASPGVASLIAFINPDGTMGNVIFAVVTIVIAFATAFIVTRIVGIQEEE